MKKIIIPTMLVLATSVFAQETSSLNISSSVSITRQIKIKKISTNSCQACHGIHFEKSALNKSAIVADMTNLGIKNALVGYKNGTRNEHGMGALMKAQVSKYNKKELSEIANEIKPESKVDKIKNVLVERKERTMKLLNDSKKVIKTKWSNFMDKKDENNVSRREKTMELIQKGKNSTKSMFSKMKSKIETKMKTLHEKQEENSSI